MKNIGDFLGQFKQIQDPKDDKVVIQKIIKEVCGLDVDIQHIKFNETVLKLAVSGPEKTAIFMKQTKLLERFNQDVPKRKIEKIY